MVFEADAAGTLIEILADEGATLPIGEVIARVGEAGEASEERDGSGRRQRKSPRRPRCRGGRRQASKTTPPTPRRPHSARTPSDASRRARRGRKRRRAGQGLAARAADRRRAGSRPRRAAGLGARGADHQGRRRVGARRGRARARAGERRRAGGHSPPLPRAPRRPSGQVEVVELTKLQQTVAPADGRVKGDRPALLSAGRDRHERRGRGPGSVSRPRPPRATWSRPSTTWWSRPAPWP